MTVRDLRLVASVWSFALLAACAHQPVEESLAQTQLGARAAGYALHLIGAPYRYGGSTPRGFDCSGLVQYSYARAGVWVPRSTKEQRRSSQPLPVADLLPGDLLFFNERGKRGSHVALYVGNGRFVHAPSTGKHVQLATLRDPYWRHHLLEARRLTLTQ
jgi:murein DD-endopeptidase